MQTKKEYYSHEETVTAYSGYRYGGKSGNYVNKREIDAISSLIPSEGKVLDAPCGLGRISSIFKNHKKYGFDYSPTMLKYAKDKYDKIFRGDIKKMPFKNNEFDILVSIRFLFHYRDVEVYIKEFSRVLKKGGIAILETYSWSPLQFDLPYPKKVGGRVFVHLEKKMKLLFQKNGLKVVKKEKIFLFSPFVYRYLPFFVVRVLDKVEDLFPDFIKPVVYWKIIKY